MAKRKFTYDNGSGGIAQVVYDTAIESRLGGYKSVEKDHPYEYAIMSKDMLDDVRDGLKSIKDHIDSCDRQKKQDICNLKQTYQTEMDKKGQEYKADIDHIKEVSEKEIAEWREKYNHEAEMNSALRNASKERANRVRKMDKHGSGFKPLGWSTFSYKLMHKDGNKMRPEYFNLYKIIIQTYYDVSLTLDQVDAEIKHAIISNELKLGNCSPRIYDEKKYSVDQILQAISDDEEKNENTEGYLSPYKRPLILRRDYKCDYQKGFWEVTFITNFPYEKVYDIDGEDKY